MEVQTRQEAGPVGCRGRAREEAGDSLTRGETAMSNCAGTILAGLMMLVLGAAPAEREMNLEPIDYQGLQVVNGRDARHPRAQSSIKRTIVMPP